jgi:CubicO group peptidase (beta-lactamase class C family)
MKRLISIILALLFLFGVFFSSSKAVKADEKLDASILEEFFYNYFSERTFTGAAASVVQDGKILFSRGYGYEDTERSIPVDPSLTRFRVGSITKTLVGTGLANFLSEGRIQSIDDPVNKYLKELTIPKNNGVEITFRMLATHQAGFAENPQHFVLPGDSVPELTADYFKKRMPPYITNAGSGSNYSNYGIDLLAFILGDIAGMPYEVYVQEHIFKRAGMTGAELPREPKKYPHLSDSQIFYSDGTTLPIQSDWNQAPINTFAGGLVMTADDAAKFMIGLLGGNEQIPDLLPNKAREYALTRQNSYDMHVQGFTTVFMQSYWNGELLFGHDGNTLGTNSVMIMIPDKNIGIFLTVSCQPGTLNPLFELLGIQPGKDGRNGIPFDTDKPFPVSSRFTFLPELLGIYIPAFEINTDSNVDLKEFVGDYVSYRRDKYTSSTWINQLLFNPNRQISLDGNGGLRIGASAGYLPMGNDIFYKGETGTNIVKFDRDSKGKVTAMHFYYSDQVFKKTSKLLSPFTSMKVLFWAIIILFTGLFAFYFPKKMKGKGLPAIMMVLIILLPIVYFLFYPRVGNESLSHVSRTEEGFILFQLLGNFIAVLAGYFIYLTTRLFIKVPDKTADLLKTKRGKAARVHMIILAVGCLFLIWAFANLGLIGWNIYGKIL